MKSIIATFCLMFFLNGCITVLDSPTPRFYLLDIVNEKNVEKKVKLLPDVFVGVGPIKIPEYQNRPQIVIRNKSNLIEFSQFDRWGESLDFGIERLIEENLSSKFDGIKFVLYPWSLGVEVKYQVIVNIIKLDSQLDGEMFFVAQWQIIDARNVKTKIINRFEFRKSILPQNYAGLIKTLSLICTLLSDEIGNALITLE